MSKDNSISGKGKIIRKRIADKNLIGKEIGKLTVVKHLGKVDGKNLYHCECKCGGSCSVLKSNLINGGTTSCGCLRQLNINDIVGKTFGRLKVIELSHHDKSQKPWKYYYSCECSCGNKKTVIRTNLLCGNVASCGCYQKQRGKLRKDWKGHEDLSKRAFTSIRRHAETRDLEFKITMKEAWEQFVKQNKKCALTGIDLSIEKNYKDAPERTASLDRIDSSKGYTPDNIQWVHKWINVMKWDLTQEEFISMCKMVTEHRLNG